MSHKTTAQAKQQQRFLASSPSPASLSSQKKSKVFVMYDQFLEARGYKLMGTIGVGSYAKVKEAYNVSRKRRLAVKIIDERRAPVDFMHKFLPRELDIYKILDHPSIVKVYEIIQLCDRIYIFMELADGGDLLEYIKKKGALSNQTANKIFYELANAIRYCHSIQIAHRDLKCENILLDKNMHVKLADFGFSRSCVDSMSGKRVLSQTYCGSAAYAAPEILQGSPYNPKLYDIWSLGVILFIMVCGYMPFDDSDISKMIRAQLNQSLRYNKKVNMIVRDLIGQMLQPEVMRRANIDKILRHEWFSEAHAKSINQ